MLSLDGSVGQDLPRIDSLTARPLEDRLPQMRRKKEADAGHSHLPLKGAPIV